MRWSVSWGNLAHFPRVVRRTLPAGVVFHNHLGRGGSVWAMWQVTFGRLARLVVVVGVLAAGLGFVGASGQRRSRWSMWRCGIG